MTEIVNAQADIADEPARRGLALYREKLQSLLEPAHNGEVVAIHIDSGDYIVAPSSGKAMRAMRELHEDGQLLLHTIGPVTVDSDSYGLAARILGLRSVRQSETDVEP